MYFYYPHERRSPRRSRALRQERATVVVSAGHGLYYHHGFQDWRPQRGVNHGITEDYITPRFADELATELRSQGLDIAFTRSIATARHEPTRSPWWKVGARYHLQSLYPDRPDIWHSLPDATHTLREYDEDIRSRPLFANLIGAAAIMHLHTNAAAPEATGTRVYYQTGDTDSQTFATAVLCGMKESIQAVERYRGYRVPLTPIAGNYGENRLADMPSALIEIGFHTHPDDAAAMQDPVFQAAAMKGAALGYQRYVSGQSCPAISAEPDA
jgi:N-acetylmuramoyl-L-alanine amidase